MATHYRAWEGFRIVILAKTPMLAMRLEQAIATAIPAIEVQLSSFESYEQAYKFCKEHNDVGFFFIAENCHSAPFQEVFRELSAHYQSNSKAFGVVLYEKESNRFSERIVDNNPYLLDYLSTNDILNTTKTTQSIGVIWEHFLTAFEETVLNRQLKESLFAQAESLAGSDSINFIMRLTTNLCSALNLSWYDEVALRWAPILSVIGSTLPAPFLKPHKEINNLLSSCFSDLAAKGKDIISVLNTNLPLNKKIFELVMYLENHRRNGTLKTELEKFSSIAKPGAQIIFRHIAKHKMRILEIERESQSLGKVKVA